jgi:ferrous iron transport protein B
MKIALVGNPNCGKTTIFNALTGARQKVGNWAGVTVDKKSGHFVHDSQSVEVVDLPGLYSLVGSDGNALDEQIACKFILNEKPDAVINVVDASNFERNLFLTMQLIEMGVPVILAVNMIDVAKDKGFIIHFDKLEKELGIKVIPMIGRKAVGIHELKDAVVSTHKSASFDVYQYYPQQAIKNIQFILAKNNDLVTDVNHNWLAIRLVKGDVYAKSMVSETSIQSIDEEVLRKNTRLSVEIPSGRYKAISHILSTTCNSLKVRRHRLTEMVDSVCMNKYLGLPIFLFIMYMMFEFSITIGGALQPLFDDTSRVIFIDGAMHLGMSMGLPLWLTAVFSQGIGLGINTVLTFIPQIGCMFLFLSLLEDSGYMARAAFVMDRIMQSIGLPGKSFVPLIVGFGCNVPAVMATRTLETRRDRLLTIMMAPFVSCGARLAIFAVFASAFFPTGGALIVFLLYILGIMGAIITGLVVKGTLLKGDNTPFIMEIPVYHLPNVKTILIHTWNRLKRFIFRAGKIIIPVCLLIGALNSIQLNGHVVVDGSRDSILSQVGKTVTPIFEPMGVQKDNWPATVGLVTGVLAKEVVVGTLNTLYTQDKPQDMASVGENYDFWGQLGAAFTTTFHGFKNMTWETFANPFTANEADGHMDRTSMGTMVTSFGSTAAAFAYLLFVLLYVPCVATIGAMSREAGRGWAWLSVLWSTALAYCAAVIVYQASQIFVQPMYASINIIIAISALGSIIYAMHYFSDRTTFRPQFAGGCGDACSAKGGCH